MVAIARWESRGGAHYAVLHESNGCYSYTGNGCGGGLGAVESREAAVAIVQARVDSGYFLPDSAKVPMKRVRGVKLPVRVVLGPTYLDGLDVQEVVVHLAVYSGKLAHAAWRKLPDFAEFDGRIYRKHGFRAADCTAWYRSEGK